MRRALIFVALLVGPVAVLLAFPPGSPAERVDVGTGYELENVHVLDPGTRLADARRMMMEMNVALGVQCRDCHNPKSFASDEKPLKLVARDMMRMQREINERWFPGEDDSKVTCWTCHQGQRIPPGGPEDATLHEGLSD